MAIHEECGVFGVTGLKRGNVAGIAYYGLYALQHRGQESCAINWSCPALSSTLQAIRKQSPM